MLKSEIGASLVRGTTTVNLVSSASYLPFGPLSTITFANGEVLNKVYDANHDIDQISSGAINLDYRT